MKTLKTLIIALAIPALLLAAAGCKEPEVEKNPPTNITVTKADGSALPSMLTFAIDQEVVLAVSAKGASSYDWDVDDTATVELVAGGDSATATFKGKAAGTASIIAYARNKDGWISREVAVEITEEIIPPGTLVLTVTSGGVGTWSNNTHLTISPDANLTLTVTGRVDGENVTLTSTEWEVTGTEDIVTIGETTGVVTILQRGTTEITVRAEAEEADDPATKEIALVVKRVYGDDVIFEWDLSDISFSDFIASQESPATITSPAGGTPGTAGDPCIPLSSAGGVTHPDFSGITLRSYGTQIPYNNYTGEKGFRLGGYNSQGGPRFVIGQGTNQETSGSTTSLGGQIDLSQRKVKVTVGYANIVETANRYHLRIAVNNNTNTAANSPLDADSTIKTFIWDANSSGDNIKIETDAASGTEFVKQGSTKTAGELYAVIDPTEFASKANKATLQNAFIMLHAQHSNNSGISDFAQGNWITITYIKIEYTGEVVVQPPIALTVKDGENTEVGASIAMDLGDPDKTLTATSVPADAAVTWSVSGESVTLSATTGASTAIMAVKAGSTTINVSAAKEGYSTAYKQFVVVVTDPNPADVVLFEWSSSTQPWTELNSGAGNSKELGVGDTSATARTYGTRTFPAADNASILLGGKNMTAVAGDRTTSAAPRFVIGQATMQASASTDASTISYNGEFNLLNKKILLTISYKDVNQNTYTNRDTLSIRINNNGTSSGDSYLGVASQVRRFVDPAALITASEPGSTASSGTVKIPIDCTVAALADKETMNAAFICLYTMHDGVAGGAGTGNWITITGIKIEYTDN